MLSERVKQLFRGASIQARLHSDPGGFNLGPDEKNMGDVLRQANEQAEGAIPNGTRVEKINSNSSDAHVDGSEGIIVASVGPIVHLGRMTISYFVCWDDAPDFPVGILDSRVRPLNK